MNPELKRAIELASEQRHDEARAIVSRLADAGDPDALYALADMYWRGALVDRDWAKARETFAAAEAAGNRVAGHLVTNLLASGMASPADWPGAIARLSKEAAEDDKRAAAMRLIEAMDLDEAGYPAHPPEGRQLLSSPDLREFLGLFSKAECQHLCALAEPLFAPSLVTGPNLEQIPDPVRTSDCASLHELIADPAVTALNRRLAVVSESKLACGEVLLILRYEPGQHYLDHLDALPGLDNQRVKTVLVYLNDGYEGGHTAFPAAGQSYRGQIGDGIVFRNVLDNGRPDQRSMHAGLPVAMGTKYLASRWIRERTLYDERGPAWD